MSTIVQQAGPAFGTAAVPRTATQTFATAPTAGRLVIGAFGGNKNSTAVTANAGFTKRAEYYNTSVSLAVATAAGTNGGTWTWTGQAEGVLAFFETDIPTGWTYRTSAVAPSPATDTAVSSIAADAGTSPVDGVAFAVVSVDSSWDDSGPFATAATVSFTNGYSLVGRFQGDVLASHGAGGAAFVIGKKDLTSADRTTSTTCSWTGGADQAAMGIVVVDVLTSQAESRTGTSSTATETASTFTVQQGEQRTETVTTAVVTAITQDGIGHTATDTPSTGVTATGAVTSVAHTGAGVPSTGVTTGTGYTVAHTAFATSTTAIEIAATFTRDSVALPATGPLFFNFWVVDRATGAYVAPLPDYRAATVSPVFGEPGAISIDYPFDGINYDLLRDGVSHERDLEVAVWVGGRKDAAMRAILMESDADVIAEQGMHRFGGHFLEILLDEMVLLPVTSAEKQETIFSAATAGSIVLALLQRAHTAGYLIGVSTTSFTSTLDSNGAAWGQTATVKWSPGRKYIEVLADLAQYGLCEWEITPDRELRLYKFGTRGTDLTLADPPVILRRGQHLTDSPRKTSVRESGTDLLAAGKEGLYRTESDASATARRGRKILRYASANSIEDPGALTAWAQAQLLGVTAGQDERAHGLSFGKDDPLPIADYGLGDWVGADTGNPDVAFERQRVMQWTFAEDENGEITGSIITGTPFLDQVDRLRRRVAAIEGGTVVVGTSTPSEVEDTMAPAAPVGVVVDSLAYNDGYDTYATLIVGWSQVTENADGSVATDVAGYRVQWRPQADPTDGWRLGADVAGATATSTSFGGVGAGVDVLVRVAAYDSNGNQSAWSAEVVTLTQTDNTPPPVPSTPQVSPYLGQLKVRWDGLGSAGEAMPADLDRVEVHLSQAAAFTPTDATLVDTFSTVAGERVITDLPYDVTHYARLVAVDRTTPTPNRSAPSAVGAAAPTKVVGDDVFAGAIGDLQLANLAVKTAKIDLLAVNDAQFGSGSFGKLTAGTISVAVTNAGIIRTGTSGQRTEQDAAGFRAYNSSGTQTVGLTGSFNFILGEYRTALTGTRRVDNPGGTSPDESRYYPDAGSAYAKIQTRTFVGQALIDMIGGTTRSDGKTGQAGCHPQEGYARWGLPESTTPHSYVLANQFAAAAMGPQLDFIVEQRQPNAVGDARKMTFQLTNSSGAGIANSLLWLRWGGIDQPWLARVNGNCGLIFDTNSLSVVNGAGSFGPIAASAFDVDSSSAVKDDIDDARALLDPLAVIRAARAVKFRYTADKWFTPPPTEQDPHPEPVPVEAPDRIGVIVEDLPEVLQRPIPHPDGTTGLGVDLASQIGVLWGAVGQIQDQQIRSVAGRVALPSGPLAAGATVELPVAWDEAPLEVPTGGVVTVYAAIAWLGRTTAHIVPGSLTAAGCTVSVRALATVTPSAGNPITVEAQALYLWAPPYTPEAP